MRRLGLYIHIPFCKSKCIYCDFYSLAHGETQMDAYCTALCAQLRKRAAEAAEYEVDTVYFGGGTPSYFGAARLCRVLGEIRAQYRLTPDAEITFEANPDSARNEDDLRTLRKAGFNRISLGMQSADDALLRTLGRIHTHADTAAAVQAARSAGFDNLSLDLIYGLPGQSMERWESDLRAVIDLAPEHLSCYGLKVEEGTPLYRNRRAYTLPDDEAQADFYLAACDILTHAGYEQYEISNFARDGRISRHNSRYWNLGEYLGFGPGAHSDFRGERFAIARDLAAYCAEEILESERYTPSEDERLREQVMLALRTSRGLSLAELNLPTGKAETFLSRCRAEGLAAQTEGRWHLTPRGFLVSNAVILAVQEALGL